jgi:C_GCAxxG_C_C family probable redox protein
MEAEDTRAATLERVAARSEALFRQGFYCAESVVMAIAEEHGIRSELIPRMATGFCGGVARTGGICGAVSGGVMAIGMVRGRDDEKKAVEDVYGVVRDFIARFELGFGSSNCCELIGCRLDTPDGQAYFRDNGLWDKCRVFTREATRLTMASLQAAK